MRDPDSFLDTLTEGLQPVSPLRAWPLWAGAAIAFVVAALSVIVMQGPRPEMVALMHGVWPAQFAVVGKPLLFIVTGLSALWGVVGLVRPQGHLRKSALVPIATLVLLILILFGVQYVQSGPVAVAASLEGGDVPCFLTILGGGLVGLAVLWGLWLRKAATSHPVALGAMSGLAAASLMAAAYAIHCSMDAPVYILLIYGAAVGVFTLFSALIGGKLLRW